MGATKSRGWTEEEDRLLIENYQSMSLTKLGEELGCSGTAVLNRAKVLGIWKPKRKGGKHEQ